MTYISVERFRSGKVSLESFITDLFPLEQITAGFDRQLDKDQAMKVMLQP